MKFYANLVTFVTKKGGRGSGVFEGFGNRKDTYQRGGEGVKEFWFWFTGLEHEWNSALETGGKKVALKLNLVFSKELTDNVCRQ